MNETSNYKSSLLIIGISFSMGFMSFAFAFHPLNTVTILQTGVQAEWTVEVIETGKISSWQQVLNINSNGAWNWEVKKTDQRQGKPILVSKYLEHNVDCSKIVMHNDFATEYAKYYCSLLPNKIMLSAYNQESWYNPNALWKYGEQGVCQLMPWYNKEWLKNPLWKSDRKRQAQRCVDKRVAVEDHAAIRASVSTNAYKKYLYLFE